MSSLWGTLANIAVRIFGFILTRFEKRKRVVYSIYVDTAPQELEFSRHSINPYLVIQVTNSSPRPITLNTKSLRILTPENNIISEDLRWFTAGKDKGQFPKLSQADEMRFFTKFSEFLGVLERMGYNRGKVILSLLISDSENETYRAVMEYDLDNWQIKMLK